MRKPKVVDRSGELHMDDWTCDRCLKPLMAGEARYSIADNPDERKGRHYECHVLKNDELDADLDRIQGRLGAAIKTMTELKKFKDAKSPFDALRRAMKDRARD